MKIILAILALGWLSYASCPSSISIEEAIRIAKPYVGEVISTTKTQSKKTGECYYRVRGTEGTANIDANTGKLIRFYRSR